MTRVAAVDCGTNTVKLLICETDPRTGKLVELVREARMVRLGEGVDATGRFAEQALLRLFAACEEYAALLAAHGVDRIRFCATSAARDADNADVFRAGVERRLGVVPEIVSGAEEARLSYAGATGVLHDAPDPVGVVDIGGGSTEVVVGTGGAVAAAASLDIGSVRMTERHLHSDPPSVSQVQTLVAQVDEHLDLLSGRGVDVGAVQTLVAVSGTGLTVAAAALDLGALDRAAVDGARVTIDRVHEIAAMFTGMTTEQRRALPYMHPGRADVIAAGALILSRVCARAPVTELRTSVSDILDGIALSLP